MTFIGGGGGGEGGGGRRGEGEREGGREGGRGLGLKGYPGEKEFQVATAIDSGAA